MTPTSKAAAELGRLGGRDREVWRAAMRRALELAEAHGASAPWCSAVRREIERCGEAPDGQPTARRHPEQRDGEVLLCNSTPADLARCGWFSKRLGMQAFDDGGQAIGGELRPLFVARAELERALGGGAVAAIERQSSRHCGPVAPASPREQPGEDDAQGHAHGP
jgi:hypothetical protein